ncbi:TIR domain-containing protein [Thermogemmatispora sp.]|uniref:TIR domain-containing protein n=1 Tax=Thermogemmatispora sp. TaxID=1968838 RepID=UPI0035E46349
MEKERRREPESPLRLVALYAPEDERFWKRLFYHLAPMGLAYSWILQQIPEQIPAGTPLALELQRAVAAADLLVILVSPDLLASRAYEAAIALGLDRLRSGEMRLIPILVRITCFEGTPFGSLQVLPRGGRALTTYSGRMMDEALSAIAQEIALIGREIQQGRRSLRSSSTIGSQERRLPTASEQPHSLGEVFKRMSMPTVTFVPPASFERLKLALAEPGRSVVVEGPSGIGKTTAVRKAIEQLAQEQVGRREDPVIALLSARVPTEREQLRTLPQWHRGTVIIDDFHRLEPDLRQELVDYLKLLADTQPEDRKLAIIGIPGTGQSFVSACAFDTATRFDHFKMGRASDEKILQLIEQGEQALNVIFARKEEIIRLVDGSFSLTQLLCYYLCVNNKVLETQPQPKVIESHLQTAIQDIMDMLENKFGQAIKHFAAAGGPYDQTSLSLLKELGQSREGALWLCPLQQEEPERARGLERFRHESWPQLMALYPDVAYHFFCEPSSGMLLAEDPELVFYLRHCDFEQVAREVGKRPAPSRKYILICYDRSDRKWLSQLRCHRSPIERQGTFDIWDDTLISAGHRWEERLEEAITRSGVAIVLVSARLLAADFIATRYLPRLLEQARTAGTLVIPIIVSPCLFEESELHRFQPANDPQRPLARLPRAARDSELASIARRIIAAVTTEPERT